MTLLVLQHRYNLQTKMGEAESNHELVNFRKLIQDTLHPVFQSNYELHTIEDIESTERLLTEHKLFTALETQELSLLYQDLAGATYNRSVVNCHKQQPQLHSAMAVTPDKTRGIELTELLGP